MKLEHLKFAFNEVLGPDASSWTAPEQIYEMFKKKNILFGMLYHCKAAIDSELPGYEARRKKRKNETKQLGAVERDNCENIPPSNVMTSDPNENVTEDHQNVDPGVCIFETFIPGSHECASYPTVIQDSDPVDFANDCRIAADTQDDQDMMLSLIWSLPHCRQLFHAFPEVLFIDGTHKTNNEKYPLFTVGIRDENFKMNVILRAFCPNEKAWMFQWLFKEAIPAVLGADACQRVCTILTDGDSQETAELDAAISMGIYGNAVRRRCGWHIIHQGCKNILFPKFITGVDKDGLTKEVVGRVKMWVQRSLMKNVETDDEFRVYVACMSANILLSFPNFLIYLFIHSSKALLFFYVESMAGRIGRANADGIVTFLRDHVFKHEDRFAANVYNSCRSLGDYSNTPLEGTNGGLKYCNFAVKPNMPISKSASYMICQDESKHNEKIRTAYNNFSKTRLYGFEGDAGKATKRIVPGALGEMANQIDLASSLCSIRSDDASWMVRIAKESNNISSSELIPRFYRTRKIQRDEFGGFHCSCPYTNMYGIPCRHVVHVVQSYCSEAYYFSHHDVDIRWWTPYSFLVALKDPLSLDEEERAIKAELIRLRLCRKLCIGRDVVLEPFHGEVYVCGSKVINSELTRLSVEEATARLFVEEDVSYPVNYERHLVDSALMSVNEGYNGLKMMYSLSYKDDGNIHDDWDTNTMVGNSGSIELTTDFSSRVIERPMLKIDHHQVMKSVYKSLWDAFENCTDEFFHMMKEECEAASREMMIRVQQHIVQNSGKVNISNGGTVSCRPTNVVNVPKEHKKQKKW
jgi:hypothetical protein